MGVRTGGRLGRGGSLSDVSGATITPPAAVAPILSTVTPPVIDAEGASLTLTLTRNVVFGAGGNGGFLLNPTGSDVTLTYASGSGTNILVYTISRAIMGTETAVLDYTQPGNGVEAAAGGLDLATLTGNAVTNNSGCVGMEHVADLAARLSLTGISPGYQVIQDDNATTYQYNAASTAQGGVFVSGGTQDGVYTKRGTANDRDSFNLIGTADCPDCGMAVYWGGVWAIKNEDDGGLKYYSLSDVATPDLATDWLDASDDTPAAISVASVSSGKLAAGVTKGAAIFALGLPANGRNTYEDVGGIMDGIHWESDLMLWRAGDDAVGNTAFPWEADWSAIPVTVTRNDIASESNWTTV